MREAGGVSKSNGPVGVVGLGTIGIGVCQSILSAGYDVIGVDSDAAVLRAAPVTLAQNERMLAMLRSGEADVRVSSSRGEFIGRSEIGSLGECWLVIENITEDVAQKRGVFEGLSRICSDCCMFLANTSCIPISEISKWITRPQRLAGAHFMNPVPLKPLVEMIETSALAEGVKFKLSDFLASMGKKAIWVNDQPGFVINRILMPVVNDAIRIVEEGTSNPADVDRLFVGCLGHKMGPLATADLIGLDTVLKSLDVLYDFTQDSRFRATEMLSDMVSNGQLGRKSGEGFFKYVK